MVSHQTEVLFPVVFQHESHNIRARETGKLPPIFTNSLQMILHVGPRAHCTRKQKNMYMCAAAVSSPHNEEMTFYILKVKR